MKPFVDRIMNAATPVVMEIKPRSAAGEDLIAGRSIGELVECFQRLDAPCLSVVTGRWFGGERALLREVLARSDVPVLEKDFITTRRRVAEAREMGVSALLLTAELLPASSLQRLIDACLSVDLTPFVEVSGVEQIGRVVHPDRCVIAVNNKEIRRRELGPAEVERSLALLPAIRAAGAACAVSASGIATPEIGARLLAAGFDALLVGTALLGSANARDWIAQLLTRRGPIAHDLPPGSSFRPSGGLAVN
jgi:indole-3-glycerol phosphate synthase